MQNTILNICFQSAEDSKKNKYQPWRSDETSQMKQTHARNSIY
jgi:hypothetical protein